jgi:predicted nucleic acid-binding protein
MIHGLDTSFLVQAELREVPGHEAARTWLNEALDNHPQSFALAPQVLTEFVHVVTDPRRFTSPLSMDKALEKANGWWESSEVKPIYPSLDSTRLGLLWLRQHRLGRKRLLDTQLAAT